MTSLVGGPLCCFAPGQKGVPSGSRGQHPQDEHGAVERSCTTWLWAGLCPMLPAAVAVTISGHQILLHRQLVQSHG